MSNLPLLLNGKIIDEVSADDRAWFKNNPDCLFRLRKMVKVEFNNWPIGNPGDGFAWCVLVANMAKGVRARTPVSLPEAMALSTEDLNDLNEDQDMLAQIFDQVAPEPLRKAMKAERKKGK